MIHKNLTGQDFEVKNSIISRTLRDIQWVRKLIKHMPTIFCFLYIPKTKVARQVQFSPYDRPSSLILVYKISSDNFILLKFY